MKDPPQRNSRSIGDQDFPSGETLRVKLEFLLNFAVLAPSNYNTQPWFFRVEDDSVELYADWSRRLTVLDPQGRELIMSCGAALLHLQLAMRHYGWEPRIETFLDDEPPILLARVQPGDAYAETLEEQLVFEAIVQRRTNRQPFGNERLPIALVTALEHIARDYGTELCPAATALSRLEITELIEEAERTQFADPAFRKELSEWIHGSTDERQDGLQPRAFGHPHIGDWMTPLAAAAVRSLNLGESRGTSDARLAAAGPFLAVLTTRDDSPCDWFNAGQSMAHLLLLACSWGVSASFFNQPIEVPALRSRLMTTVSTSHDPQFLFRMGFGPDAGPTPRRPVEQVLLRESRPVEGDVR